MAGAFEGISKSTGPNRTAGRLTAEPVARLPAQRCNVPLRTQPVEKVVVGSVSSPKQDQNKSKRLKKRSSGPVNGGQEWTRRSFSTGSTVFGTRPFFPLSFRERRLSEAQFPRIPLLRLSEN